MEAKYYVVENVDPVEQTDSDLGANEHRISLPVIAGPFETVEDAETEAAHHFADDAHLLVEIWE